MAQAETIADTSRPGHRIVPQLDYCSRELTVRGPRGQAEKTIACACSCELGDATSAEYRRAEHANAFPQAFLNSIHDYLIAVARLEYAMGVTPSSAGTYAHR